MREGGRTFFFHLSSLHSCGGVYCGDGGLPIGHLCTVEADDSGRANFQLVSGELKVWEVIGRAMVLHRTSQPQDSDRFVGRGIGTETKSLLLPAGWREVSLHAQRGSFRTPRRCVHVMESPSGRRHGRARKDVKSEQLCDHLSLPQSLL